MDKQYIRLVDEGKPWDNQVAVFVESQKQGPSRTPMCVFIDPHYPSRRRIVPEDEAVFITEKEYFTSVLKGESFDN